MSRFVRALKGIFIHGGVQLLMFSAVVGVIFIAPDEIALYQQDAQIETTVPPTASPQAVQPSSTSQPEPKNTITPTRTAEPTITNTPTLQNTSTKTVTATAETATIIPSQEITPITDGTCGPPEGWVQYTVQSGDNLYRISLKFRTSVAAIREANCMGTSNIIVTGSHLWVPNVTTSTPQITNTATKSNAAQPAPTGTNTTQPTTTDTLTPTTTHTPTVTVTETTP